MKNIVICADGTGNTTITGRGTNVFKLFLNLAGDLSPDGRWVFSIQPALGGVHYELLPTGAGEPNKLPTEGLTIQNDLNWLPDGKSVLFNSNQDDIERRHVWRVAVAGGKPVAVTIVNQSADRAAGARRTGSRVPIEEGECSHRRELVDPSGARR